MAPILLNAAASVAGNVIDAISERFSHHHGVKKTSGAAEDNFDAEMALAQTAATPAAATAVAENAPADAQNTLMSRLMGTPEVATALAGANPLQSVQLEMTAAGSVSMRSSDGQVHALKVSDGTRDLVSQLYSTHQLTATSAKVDPVAVLAVDPAHTAAATWSNLPARTA